MRAIRTLSAATLLLLGLTYALPALSIPAPADPAPSTDAMINSLAGSDVAKPCASGCRGIRAIAPSAEPAPSAHATQLGTRRGTLDLSVEFASGSSALAPSAEHVLNRLGQALTNPRLNASRFRIEGHTDTVGDEASNQTLSEQRAQAVAAYLEQKFGIEAARLETVGVGEKDLAVETPDETAEPRNRRVYIANLGS